MKVLGDKFLNKSSEIVLNVDGTRTERKVRLSNIDVHETISENVNSNSKETTHLDNNVNQTTTSNNHQATVDALERNQIILFLHKIFFLSLFLSISY